MTDWEAIEARISRRRFLGALPQADADQLEEAMQKLNEEKGLHMRLVRDDPGLFGGFAANYGMFSGTRSMLVLAGAENDANVYEKVGYAGERLALEAVKLGLGTCWVAGTFDRKGVEKTLQAGQMLVAVIAMGAVTPELSSKEKILMKAVHTGADKLCWQVEGEAPAWFMAGAKAAQRAPSERNSRPAQFLYKDGRATAQVPGKKEMQFTDLGIAKLHFEIGAGGQFPLGNQAEFIRG